MTESLGSLKLTNGSSSVHGKMNGQSVARQRPAPKRRGLAAYLVDAAARLTIWAIIFTIIFRCPSSPEECDETSPVLCEQYFRAKSLAAPYVQPFYDDHVVPYVDLVKPYYAVADTYALTPARAYAVEYGGPLVDKVRDKASQQWMRHAQPTVTNVREQFQENYNQFVAPHLTTLSELSQPVLRVGRKALQQLYFEVLLPLFEFAKPYALQGYDAASDFTTGKAFPAVYWAWSKMTAFLDRAVWPQVRMVYVENIEPQLVRIGERLERYKNRTGAGLKPKSPSEPLSETTTHTGVSKKPVESPQSTFSRPAPQSTSLPGPGAVDSQSAVGSAKSDRTIGAPWKPARAPVPSENETEQRRKAREMVSKDLDMWQNKFAAQADEGALAMEEHIDEIAQRMLFEGVAVKGHDLLRKLESTTESELELLKTRILSLVSDVSSREDDHADADADADANPDANPDADADADADAAEDSAAAADADADADVISDEVWKQVVSAIRSAGLSIKKAARAVRDWRDTYEKELQALVLEAATVHFQILDETRGLALQQIGMKWAWTDGVTYKDWAKYHDLKKTLSEWTEELKKLIVTNPTLLQAQEASALIEDDGMAIASAAAHELARLKEVAHFKLLAKDTTDNFDLEDMKQAAEAPHRAAETPAADAEDEEVVTSSRRDNEEFEPGEETDGSEKPQTTLSSSSGVSDEATISPAGETDSLLGDDHMTEGQSTSDPVLPTTGFVLAEGFSFESHEKPIWDDLNETPPEMEQTPERIVVDSDPEFTTEEAQAEILTGEEAAEAMFSAEDSGAAGPIEADEAAGGSGEERQDEKCATEVPYRFTPNEPLFSTHG